MPPASPATQCSAGWRGTAQTRARLRSASAADLPPSPWTTSLGSPGWFLVAKGTGLQTHINNSVPPVVDKHCPGLSAGRAPLASSGEMVRIVNGELIDDSAPAPASGPLAFSSGMSMGAGMLLRACVCLLARVCECVSVRECVCIRVRPCANVHAWSSGGAGRPGTKTLSMMCAFLCFAFVLAGFKGECQRCHMTARTLPVREGRADVDGRQHVRVQASLRWQDSAFSSVLSCGRPHTFPPCQPASEVRLAAAAAAAAEVGVGVDQGGGGRPRSGVWATCLQDHAGEVPPATANRPAALRYIYGAFSDESPDRGDASWRRAS
jgi:hypothetical protein